MSMTTIPTRDTRIAAAFGSLGILCKNEVIYDERSSTTSTTFHLSSTSADGSINTKQLRASLNDETLGSEHPLVDCLRAIRNRRRLLDFLKDGCCIHLKSIADGTRSYFAEGGTGLPGVHGQPGVVKTTDLHAVAALAGLGVSLLAVEGSVHGKQKFILSAHGEFCAGARVNAGELLRDFRSGALAQREPEHPFLYAMMAQHNYCRLKKSVDQEVELILLRKPNSRKAAYISAKASEKAYDRVSKHFGV